MRHVLVDHARTRRTAKRVGEVRIEQLDDGADAGERDLPRSSHRTTHPWALFQLPVGALPIEGEQE